MSTTNPSDDQSFFEQPSYTNLTVPDARMILSYYSGQPYGSHQLVTGGVCNSNYCIISKDESYYFCKICDEETEENIWKQVKVLIALQSYGLPLSYPLKRRNNPVNDDNNTSIEAKNGNEVLITDYILHISSIEPPIVMYEWKHSCMGTFTSLSSTSYTSLGTAVARIHSIDYNEFLYLPCFSVGLARMLPLYYEELPTVSHTLQQHPFVTVLEKELERICQTLYKKTSYQVYKDRDYIMTNDKMHSKEQSESLSSAILHGDIFLGNVLFQPNGELDAIVDWELISVGERLIDVTMTIVGCCYDNSGTLSISRATAFLSAYQNILPFTPCERKYFETFLRYSLLSTASFRWHRFNVQFPSDHRCGSYLQMLKSMDDIDSEVIQQLLSV